VVPDSAQTYGKYFFTIIDFKKATELFADPEWDGPAIAIKEIDKTGKVTDIRPRSQSENEDSDIEKVIEGPVDLPDTDPEPTKRFVVSGVQFKIIAERVQYYDKDGKLITESLKDFTRKAVGQEFKSLDQFRKRWNGTERKASDSRRTT
jgi:type I restriction enzyme, R subunit